MSPAVDVLIKELPNTIEDDTLQVLKKAVKVLLRVKVLEYIPSCTSHFSNYTYTNYGCLIWCNWNANIKCFGWILHAPVSAYKT